MLCLMQRPKKGVEPEGRPPLKSQKSFYEEEEEGWGRGPDVAAGGEEFVDYGKIPSVRKDIFFGKEDDYLEEVDSALPR